MKKLDPDLKAMPPAKLRQEIMRLRTAFRKELAHTGNHRCWVTLLEALPEGKNIKPLTLPRTTFINNCGRYFDRNQE